MARAALLQLLRSQSKRLQSTYLLSHDAFCYHSCRSGTWAQNLNSRLTSSSCIHVNATHRRWASHATLKDDDNRISIGPRKGGEDKKGSEIVYYGPTSSNIKEFKLETLSICCLSLAVCPLIMLMTTLSPDVYWISYGALSYSVTFFSAFIAAAIHRSGSPYIHKLRWKPGSDSFEVEMLSWLATYTRKTIKFADIRPRETNRPFVAFKANGNLYLFDAENCHNQELLARLTP